MRVEWKSSLAELTEDHYHHPGLRRARFVFCDDKPNDNGQGVEYEDFAEIIKSAIGAPVKVKFLGQTVSGHLGSVPIGHIAAMSENLLEDGTHQLIADAILYADEYPDEIEYLEKSFAEGKAPGVSWELSFKNSVLKDGINWLKGLVARAATFVREPAYGSRTALLALASNNNISAENFIKELSALSEPNEDTKETKDKGGNNVTVEELQAKLAELEGKIKTLETANAELTEKNTTLSTQLSEKDKALEVFAQKELVASRTQALVDAGIQIETDPTKLAKKQEFWASLPEEAFAEYVEDLKAVSKDKKAAASRASASRVELPRFSGREDGTTTGASDIRQRMRSLRNQPVVTTE